MITAACSSSGNDVTPASPTSGSTDSASSDSGTPPAGDATLSLGLVLPPDNLDFTTTSGVAIPQLLLGNVYETLVVQADDGSLQPGLAKKWDVSDDGTQYTFTLNEGVTFSDGSPLTAADAKFSIDYVKSDWTVNVADEMKIVTDVQAPSDTELVVTLSEPSNMWLFKMSTRIGAIMSPNHVDNLAKEAIGTGPYTVDPWDGGDVITLTRNDNYWGDAPAIKHVVFRYYEDAAAMNNALLTGDINVITTVPSPQTLQQFESNDAYQIIKGTTNGNVMMTINNAQPPLDDVRVRQAINYALDKEAILKAAWAGYGTVIGSHEVPTDPWFVDLADRYPHDVTQAKELLAQAGQEGLTLRLALSGTPYASAAAPIIVSQLAEAGITVVTEDMTFDNWLAKVYTDRDYDLTIINHAEQYDLTTVFSGEPDYYTNYTNPEVTRLETEGLAADYDTFIADFQKVVEILADDAAAAWLWAFPNLMVADANVRGLPVNAVGESLAVYHLYTEG